MFLTSIKNWSVISCAVILAACGGKQTAQQAGPPPATPVTVDEVRSTDAVYYDEYPGTVVALNQTEIRAQVTGYVTAIYFKDGEKVSKGQRLYSIDQQLYSANLDQAVANQQVQETNLLKAQKDADRYHALDKQDAIAKQQVDYADAALEAAKKQVAAAKANVNAVKANVGFATIVAPFTGTIGISQVRSGTSVIAGQTILNTISTDDPMAVDFPVDQKSFYQFAKRETSKKANDSTFSIAFGKEIYPFYGSVNTIDRAVDPQTGTIKIRLSFPNKEKMLKAGMNTTVRVLNADGGKSLVIPYKAVTEQLGEFFVYVVGDSSKVSQRKLVLGNAIGANILVKDGLKEGEKIVTEGMQNLRQGAVVTTAQPAPQGQAGTAAPKK
ncbi:MAG: efflux RND transporter periplasmic adaptor subunit [Chitinophagaceae bacterium]